MISRLSFIIELITITLVMLLAPVAAVAQSSARSVESFVGIKSQWNKLVGVPLKIEGRYSSIGGKLLRFQKCDLSFRSIKPLPKIVGKTKTVEVSGKLKKERGKIYFAIEKIRERPKDLQTVRDRQRKIPPKMPDEWYKLGSWAIARSKFYEDDELTQEASKIYLQGVRKEQKQLPKDNPDALLTLAKKIEPFPVPNTVRYEFIHEAYQIQWNVALKNGEDTKQLTELKTRLEENLPGCRIPLKLPQPKLTVQYLDDPLKKYASVDENQRIKLHRIFYSEVVLKSILKESSKDGSNGFEIAGKIDDLLPERHDLAEEQRKRELKFKMSNVASLSRRDMLAFSKLLKERNDPTRAQIARENWLAARQKLLRRDGTTGLIKLAEEYVELVDDTKSAASFLIEAQKLTPKATEVTERLNKLGYRLRDGKWISETRSEFHPDREIARAMREGRVAIGMNSDQVRKTLGAPTSLSRIATAGQISEVWVYGPRTTSRLAIHFIRRSHRSTSESTVISISQLKP